MSILSKIGLPENIAPPLPPGAKDGSIYSIGQANQAAAMNKMSDLLKVTQGGGKLRRRQTNKRGHVLKGGAMLTLPPLHVPYPGGSGISDTYTKLVSTAATNTAQSQYDTAWTKPSVGGSKRSSSKRSSSKRSSSKRSSSKRSSSRRSGNKKRRRRGKTRRVKK